MVRLPLEKYEPIAIIGVGLRLPGGNNTLDGFAGSLKCGGFGRGPTLRGSGSLARDQDTPGKVRASGRGLLDTTEMFDARFFNISAQEAGYVDPRQRLALETVWEALEHANLDPAALRHGDHGVYLGAVSTDHGFGLEALEHEERDAAIGPGIGHSGLSGRLSHFLGWHGPRVTVDTACSSSLVAIHMAVAGLRARECGVALAGGVNAIHHPTANIVFSAADMLAPDGRRKICDEAAGGYARGEGCGFLVLKRLSDALSDEDRILALIRGTAVRQNGEGAGPAVPNGIAQESVMRAALSSAVLDPAGIQYVEANGTGTHLGGPIEIGAISGLFRATHTPQEPVTVASVKTDIGHLGPAAGVAGVIKTVLQLRDGVFYPHRDLTDLSKRIPWDALPVSVPTRIRPWQAQTRRALVNSFGFTGTIAAMVLEQAPVRMPAVRQRTELVNSIFTLSAKSTTSLVELVRRHRDHLAANPELELGDVCYTSNVGRSHFGLRFAAAADDRDDLLRQMEEWLGAEHEAGRTGDIRKVAFLFAGQGTQYSRMGAPLLRRYPVFRHHFDECDRLFQNHLGRSVKALILGEDGEPELIHSTGFTQPALFSLEYALARLWLSWGVRPSALVGHSVGEISAAAVAGVLDLPDAVALVAARASLMRSVSAPGAMVAVSAVADEVAPYLAGHDDVAFAAFNAPCQCVLSGRQDSVARIVAELNRAGIRTTRLLVSHAFHSPLTEEISERFRSRLETITFHEPELTVISNRTGQVARPAELCTPDYWVRHLREPVHFADSVATVERRGRHAFIEIGPSRQLIALARRIVTAPDDHLWLASASVSDIDARVVRAALGRVYTACLPVDWTGYHQGGMWRKTDLPTYAFDRRRHRLPANGVRPSGKAASGSVHHRLPGAPVPGPPIGSRT